MTNICGHFIHLLSFPVLTLSSPAQEMVSLIMGLRERK